MPKANLIAALDIGTSNIKILIASPKKEEEGFEVIYQSQEPSFGVRRGVVIDAEKVSRVIQILLSRVRAETGQKIKSVQVNISGSHIFCTSSRGMIAVSRADRKVSKEDVERVLQSAQTLALPSNKGILEIFSKEFILDGQGGIKEVVGLEGGRLETEVLVLAGFSPYKNNLTQAVLNADLHISDIILSPLASASAVLSPRQKELGVALLDIGAGTTELAVFEEGDLIHLAVFPMGSANITNDIAIGLKTDTDTAEAIKIQRGSSIHKGSDKKEKIEANGEETLVFSQKMLTKVIEARVSEIFKETQKELKKISKQGLLPAGIVLTGGGAKLPKTVDLAKKELKLPCRIGKPRDFTGLEEELSFATACGLIKEGADFESIRGQQGSSPSLLSRKGILNKIKNIFKVFIP